MRNHYNNIPGAAQRTSGGGKMAAWSDDKYTSKSHHRRNTLKSPKRVDKNVSIYATSDILADQTDVAERYENWLRRIEPIWHKICILCGKTDRWYNIYNPADYAAVVWRNLSQECMDLIRGHMYTHYKLLSEAEIQKLVRMEPPNYASIARAHSRTQIDAALSVRRYAIGGFISNVLFTLVVGALVVVLLILLVPLIGSISSVITNANTCITNGNAAFVELNNASKAIQNSSLVTGAY
jgi:hypothetical protein